LSKAQFIELTNITASSNVNYGIWLRQSSTNRVTNSKTQTNGNIGAYVGCSNLGPIGAGCGGVGPSPGNYIFTGNIAGNANYGVALDVGAKSTIVTNQTLGGGAHNSKNDLFDANSNCGSTSGSPTTRRRPFRKLVSSEESRTTKILRATRTREGFGRVMKHFINRELTGHPEFPRR